MVWTMLLRRVISRVTLATRKAVFQYGFMSSGPRRQIFIALLPIAARSRARPDARELPQAAGPRCSATRYRVAWHRLTVAAGLRRSDSPAGRRRAWLAR